MKKLEITWLDHWATIEEADLVRYTLKSVGYFSKEDKDYIQLSQSVNPDGSPHPPYMNIAKKLILRKKKI